MAFQLFIDSVERTSNMIKDSLGIREALQANGQTMSFGLSVYNKSIPKPLGGETVRFLRDGVVEFAGRIIDVEQVQETGPLGLVYEVNCVDWTADLDTHLIQYNFEGGVAGDQVRAVIGIVGRGFTSVNTVDGPTLGVYEADLEIPSAILSRIAEAIEHQWYVDYDRDVNFFYILERAAPVVEINIDTSTSEYRELSFHEDVSQIKNRIYLTGAKAKSSQPASQNIVADGDQSFWALGYEPWDLETATVTVDSVPQEILLDSVDGFAGDGQGSAGQCYLCLDNHGVRFPDNFAPDADSELNFSFDYAYEPLVIVEDTDSINFFRERENSPLAPSDGVHEFKLNVPDLRVESEDAIWEYGQLLLARYAFPVYSIQFESLVQGWKPGQSFRAFSATARRNFDHTFYVHSVGKRIFKSNSGAMFLYDITASTSPFPG